MSCEVEKKDNEDKIIEKTNTRQISINQNRKDLLNNLKIQGTKIMEMSEKPFCQENIGESKLKFQKQIKHRVISEVFLAWLY